MLALIVSEHHCDWQQHCLVLGPGETLPERCILLLPARRYQQEVNYSDMFTPATTKRNQRRSPLAAQNYRLTDGRTVRSAIWRRQSTHRPPRACPLPTLDAGAAASRARDEHRPLLKTLCSTTSRSSFRPSARGAFRMLHSEVPSEFCKLLEVLEQRFLWQNRRELSAPIAPRPLPCTFLRRHADTWEAAAAPSRASWCRRDPRV